MRSVQSVSKLSLSVLTLMGVMMCSPLAMAGRDDEESASGAGTVQHRAPSVADPIEGEDEKQRHPFDVVEEGHPLFDVKTKLTELAKIFGELCDRVYDSFSANQFEVALKSPDSENWIFAGATAREVIRLVEEAYPNLKDRVAFLSNLQENDELLHWNEGIMVSSKAVIDGYLFETLVKYLNVCEKAFYAALENLPALVTPQTIDSVLEVMGDVQPGFDAIRNDFQRIIAAKNAVRSSMLGTGHEMMEAILRKVQPGAHSKTPHYSVGEDLERVAGLDGVVDLFFSKLEKEFSKTMEKIKTDSEVKKSRLEIASNLLRSSALPLETILATTSLSEADLRDAGILPVESDAVAAHN